MDCLFNNFSPLSKVVGGRVSNTAAGLAELGAKVAFTNTVSNDELGDFYLEEMRKYDLDAFTRRSSLDEIGLVKVF
ncbi:MAG: PfkB family carbohydrate kinase [Candidatus Midichloria sp.]